MPDKIVHSKHLLLLLARVIPHKKTPEYYYGYILEIFLELKDLERAPPSVTRTIG